MLEIETNSIRRIRAVIALRLSFICAFALTAALPLSAQHTDTLSSNNPLVAEGYTALQEGKTNKALDAFNQALEINATELPALLGRALIYAGQQNHEKAFTYYDDITQAYPRHVDAWSGRGLAAFNLEDFDEALSSFERATADKPVNGFFYESLAWTRMCRGEFQQAVQSAQTATLMYGRKGEAAIYPLLISYFAYAETGDTNAMYRTLKYAERNRPVNQWPSPVVDYLLGKIDSNDLISYVMDTAQETEAHTYIGLKLRYEQQTEAAERHLTWVSQHGDPRVFEYTLARAFKLRNSVAILAP